MIIKKQYKGEELLSDEQIGRKIVTPAVDRIVEVGTSSYYDKHKIKVGDTVYATPYELDIRKDAQKDMLPIKSGQIVFIHGCSIYIIDYKISGFATCAFCFANMHCLR